MILSNVSAISLKAPRHLATLGLYSQIMHLLLRTGRHPIAAVMRRLLTGYAVTFNRRYNRHGQLFQNRHKSILCQEDPYLTQFVLDVLKESEERFERKYELRSRGYNLDAVEERVGEIFGMENGEIYSPGKYKRLIKPRSVFCYWAVRELGETATSLAKRLGLTQSGVSKSVLRGEKIVKDMNLKLF